jgi:hypothetical protein
MIFKAYRRRAHTFTTIIRSPFFTFSSIGRLEIDNEDSWPVLEGVMNELARRCIHVERLDVIASRPPPPLRHPARVGHLHLNCRSRPDGDTLHIARFISKFSHLHSLTLSLNHWISENLWLYPRPPDPTFRVSPTISRLVVKNDTNSIRLLQWVLSQKAPITSISLFSDLYLVDISTLRQYLNANGASLTHLGLMIGAMRDLKGESFSSLSYCYG